MSTKVRYSIRFMLDLAIHRHEGLVLLKDVSKRQKISEKYLGHFVPLLKSAGLIQATRGASGGFSLRLSPEEITVKDIIEAVDGRLCLVECVTNPAVCDRSGICAAEDFWGEAANAVAKIFDSYTLASLADRQVQKEKGHEYVI